MTKNLKTVFLTEVQRKQKKYESNQRYYAKCKEDKTRVGKTDCTICGGEYSYYSKSRHLKCKKHLFCLHLIENHA